MGPDDWPKPLFEVDKAAKINRNEDLKKKGLQFRPPLIKGQDGLKVQTPRAVCLSYLPLVCYLFCHVPLDQGETYSSASSAFSTITRSSFNLSYCSRQTETVKKEKHTEGGRSDLSLKQTQQKKKERKTRELLSKQTTSISFTTKEQQISKMASCRAS